MKLNFYKNDDKKSLVLQKINLFYGYSGSGKTTFAKELEQGLLGKDKSYTINNLSILKEEKNVVSIDSKESIIDHIKLSSKSYLKKFYYEKIKNYLDDHDEILESINNQFKELNQQLSNLSDNFNKKTSLAKLKLNFALNSNDDMIDDFTNVTLDTDEISTSAAKELLFMLITILNTSEKETHIIIDDFDSFLDEETTINLFQQLSDFNGFIYLFTNKPNSIMYAIGKYGIFNIRRNNIFDFSNVLFLLKKAIEGTLFIENLTYEEYMINLGYFENSGQLETIFLELKYNSIYNFGRILTSKKCEISDTINYSAISIIPSSEYEYLFLNYINNLINNN